MPGLSYWRARVRPILATPSLPRISRSRHPLWDGRIFMDQLTRACLVGGFRLDGTADGDNAALLANLQRILAVAGVRVSQGREVTRPHFGG